MTRAAARAPARAARTDLEREGAALLAFLAPDVPYGSHDVRWS